MGTQATSNLTIVNGMPSAKRLDNGRFRIKFFCDPINKTEGWYKGNIDKWLPSFGALQDAALENGWTYPKNSDVTYDDMRLVEAGVEFIPSVGTHYVVLAYETLTATLVAEVDDKEIGPENGLNITERVLIAEAGVAFSGVVGTSTYGGKTLRGFEVENTDAFTRVVARYSAEGVLSVAQEFTKASTIVQVQALGLTAAQVTSTLSEVTSSHKLISQQETNFEGLKTNSYTYELDSYDIIDHELNGLERLARSRILAAGAAYTGEVGVTTITNGGKTLYLASFNIEDTVTYRSVDEIYVEAGVLNTSKTTDPTGLVRLSTTYLVLEAATTDPIVSRSTQNVEGLKTITVSTLQRSDGGSITSGDPTNTFGAMFNFTYPGIVGASSVLTTSFQNGVEVDNAVNRFFYQSSPVQRPIPATSYVFFQTSALPVTADYVYDGASGLWSPSEWAGGIYFGWRYQRDNFGTPIGERPSFRGFRIAEVSEIADVFQSITGTATDDDGLSGTLLLNGTTFEISVSGGPEKPDGNKYTLGTIDIEPAFIDVDGVEYYKKIITVATIPAQGGSVIT